MCQHHVAYWTGSTLRGHQEVAHGGDIPGFNGYVIRLPEEKVFVAVLSNGERSLLNSEVVAQQAAAIAIGDPFPDRKVIALASEALDAFVGTYKLAITARIRRPLATRWPSALRIEQVKQLCEEI